MERQVRGGRDVRRWHAVWALALLSAALAIWQVDRLANVHALQRGQDRAETALRLTENALAGYLARYQSVALLLADLETVRALAEDPANPDRRARIDALLKARNDQLGSSDIYLMNADGVTIAASNHDQSHSFVGQKFNYRPYFTQAISGGEGRFYGVGTTPYLTDHWNHQ